MSGDLSKLAYAYYGMTAKYADFVTLTNLFTLPECLNCNKELAESEGSHCQDCAVKLGIAW